MEFETAAIIRDRLAALSHVQAHQGINPRGIEEADVFAVEQKGGITCVQVFFFRTGQNWGNRSYFPRADKSIEAPEVLGSFLAQFYDDKPCPRHDPAEPRDRGMRTCCRTRWSSSPGIVWTSPFRSAAARRTWWSTPR